MKYLFFTFLLLLLGNVTYAAVRINEIAWSGTPESANDEWIELFNDSEESVSLENWTLKSVDGTPEILLTGSIEPAGFFLLERTDDSTIPTVGANQIYTGSLSNTGEQLMLQDAEGVEQHSVLDESWIAGTSSPERRPMMWTTEGWKTFEGAAREGIFGSPGERNEIAEPEEIDPPLLPTQIRITEISPTAIGEPEWFEVEMIADEGIDSTHWTIRQGNQEVPFLSLTMETSAQEIPFRFVGNPSPISLPDDGGTLEIVHKNGEVLATATWEKTKRGTKDGFAWGEIWNWGETKYWPWKSFENVPTHTRGIENKAAPAFPEEMKMQIDEIAPNRTDGGDFIEILVNNIPEGKALPPWNIKHNGTELFAGGGEFIEENDRITLFLASEKIEDDPVRYRNRTYSNNISSQKIWESSTKNGINKASGTLELNIWTDTGWEQTEDFVCWAEESLSETEKTRLESHSLDWDGSCFQTHKMIPNESLARIPESADSNSQNDFFRHFNGSPEEENVPQNSSPIPKILVQGSKKVYETSLNLTGLDEENATTDPDGIHDIKTWQWEIEGTSCGNYAEDNWEWSATRKNTKSCEEEAQNPNPGRIYFNFQEQEIFSVKLTVEDFSGATASTTVELTRDPFRVGGGGGNVFSAPVKKWIEKELQKENSQQGTSRTNGEKKTKDDFFEEFLENVDIQTLIMSLDVSTPEIPAPKPLPLFTRDRIPQKEHSALRKNIGEALLY